jgi:hypothetical protein
VSDLKRSIESIMRPFPAGLWTPVGVLVANPAYARPELQARFTSNAYHGTVVWSWQQAILAAGVERQLRRLDIPQPLRDRLLRARGLIWCAINEANAFRTSELWSWAFASGAYAARPFGDRGTEVDESNAAQLWSTVFLALSAPRSDLQVFALRRRRQALSWNSIGPGESGGLQ